MSEAFEEVLRFAIQEVGCEVVIVRSHSSSILSLVSTTSAISRSLVVHVSVVQAIELDLRGDSGSYRADTSPIRLLPTLPRSSFVHVSA
jgi:hypothetical protein